MCEQLNFTFHYVSINTKHLHLNLNFSLSFTFHYVSINTVTDEEIEDTLVSLHSTMFLLIQITTPLF